MAYLPLSTANLPDPAIDPAQGSSPADYFGIDTYTGNGGTIDSDFGFDCDLVWYKNRSRSNTFHYLFDQVRGDDLPLYSNDVFSEDSQFPTYHTQSFITGGSRIVRTIGDHLNFSGDSYVAWAWKANGSGVSNTVGDIPSTVSVNTESGFSIVTWNGSTFSAGATVGHGLTQAPDLILPKNRGDVGSWHCYHSALGGTKGILLNSSNSESPDAGFWNNTNPTDDVFTVGTYNVFDYNYVAYCFHSVEGFSKFGSYTGNLNADGPFVYTGFKVKWVMYKRTDSSGDWSILDTKRSIYNVADDYLYPHSSAAEASGAYQTDFLSNGFKLRGTNTQNNASGGTYIYMAFAENPFKYSNAR